jgi:hypothetical protein
VLRQSLNTRNIQIARKRLGGLLDDHIESLQKDSEATRETSRIYASDVPQANMREEPRMPVEVIADASSEDDPGLLVNSVEAFIDSCVTNGVKPPTIRKWRQME